MRLAIAPRPAAPAVDDSLVDTIWSRAAGKPAGALPSADAVPLHDAQRLMSSAIPYMTKLASAVQRRVFYVRLLSEADAPDAQLTSQDLEEAGDALVMLGRAALKAHAHEEGYDSEGWRAASRDIATRKLMRVSTPAADPMPLLNEASDALAAGIYALESDPRAVPERLAAFVGSISALLVWAR